jgi:hypothetical protein
MLLACGTAILYTGPETMSFLLKEGFMAVSTDTDALRIANDSGFPLQIAIEHLVRTWGI